MARIIDLGGLFGKLEGVLAERARRAGLAGLSLRLNLVTDEGRVRLDLSRGRVVSAPGEAGSRCVRLPQWELARLVLGYRSLAGLAAEEGVVIPDQLGPILEVLFPRGHPYVWHSDRF